MAEAPARTIEDADPFGFSGSPSKETVAKETNRVIEKIGKNKARVLAALGIAAAGFLGISGKPNSYAGGGISLPDPVTGERTTAGVAISSLELNQTNIKFGVRSPETGLGSYDEFRDMFRVVVGGASFRIYIGKSKITESGKRPGDKQVDLIRIEAGQLNQSDLDFFQRSEKQQSERRLGGR